jgi:hypothetical protein
MSEPWDEVRRIDLAELPRWLSRSQPSAEADRVHWWLQIVERLTGAVTVPDALSRNLVDRLVCVIERAVAESVLAQQEAATRLGYLAADLARRPPNWAIPTALQPDAAAARSIGQIGLSPDQATDLAARWQDQPIDVILALRTAKNLLGPVGLLQEHLTDPGLARQARRWLAVRPSLP